MSMKPADCAMYMIAFGRLGIYDVELLHVIPQVCVAAGVHLCACAPVRVCASVPHPPPPTPSPSNTHTRT
jgi:hypothetical protein